MKFYYNTSIVDLRTFDNETMGSNDDSFWNVPRNVFCFFIFSKWKKYYYNLNFDDTLILLCIMLIC